MLLYANWQADCITGVWCHCPDHLLVLCCSILGAGNKNLNKIVEAFVKVLAHGTELAEAETADQMVLLLTQMQGSLPPQVLLLTFSSLFGAWPLRASNLV